VAAEVANSVLGELLGPMPQNIIIEIRFRDYRELLDPCIPVINQIVVAFL
jgi:hypothetical protein